MFTNFPVILAEQVVASVANWRVLYLFRREKAQVYLAKELDKFDKLAELPSQIKNINAEETFHMYNMIIEEWIQAPSFFQMFWKREQDTSRELDFLLSCLISLIFILY